TTSVDGGSAEDQAGADTAADADDHEVADRVAEAVLGEGGGVGVVGHEHGQLGRGLEDALQREVGPPEVGGGEHGAGEVDDAGRADAYTEDGEFGGGREVAHQLHEDRGDLWPLCPVGRELHAGDDLAVDV